MSTHILEGFYQQLSSILSPSVALIFFLQFSFYVDGVKDIPKTSYYNWNTPQERLTKVSLKRYKAPLSVKSHLKTVQSM